MDVIQTNLKNLSFTLLSALKKYKILTWKVLRIADFVDLELTWIDTGILQQVDLESLEGLLDYLLDKSDGLASFGEILVLH